MVLIKGMTVKLSVKTQSGFDSFGSPIYTETQVDVDNVIVSPTAETEIVTDMQMYGKASTYTLCIPKGDNHVWTDTAIEFFGKIWKSIGPVTEYQEEMVPLSWNKKIKVVLYE